MLETNKYPYTDFHELNLDWVIAEIRKLHVEWSDFKILNSIRFDGPWNITKQYPSWTLVNDNNMGYISKKPVPAGIALDNTDYWGLVADYSALLADMQNRIVILESAVNANAKKEITEENHHVIIMGDSYMDGWNGSEYVPESFKPVPTILKGLHKTLGVNGFGWTQGGMGLLGLNGIAANTYVNNHYNEIAEPEKITDFVIGLGYNDAEHMNNARLATVQDALSTLASNIRSKFPNAKIYFANITAGWTNLDKNKRLLYSTAIANGCLGANIAWLGNVGHSLKIGHNYQLISSDGIHPTQYGMVFMAGAFVSGLLGSKYLATNFFSTDVQAEYVEDDLVIKEDVGVYVEDQWSSPITLNGQNVVYSKIYDRHVGRANTLIGRITRTMTVRSTANQFYFLPCAIDIYTDKVNYRPMYLLNGSWQSVSIKSIELSGERYSYPITIL